MIPEFRSHSKAPKGVFAPENLPSGNRGTNYTETDYENLRFLVVLTKSGLICSDIRKLQDCECTLEEVIISRRQYIEDDIARKRNSLSFLSELLDGKAEVESFDTDHYWNIIAQRESAGEELEIDLEDFEYDQSSNERENGMGPDIVYSFDTEDNIKCLSCEKKYRVSGWIREYPVGAYDSEHIDVVELPDDE